MFKKWLLDNFKNFKLVLDKVYANKTDVENASKYIKINVREFSELISGAKILRSLVTQTSLTQFDWKTIKDTITTDITELRKQLLYYQQHLPDSFKKQYSLKDVNYNILSDEQINALTFESDISIHATMFDLLKADYTECNTLQSANSLYKNNSARTKVLSTNDFDNDYKYKVDNSLKFLIFDSNNNSVTIKGTLNNNHASNMDIPGASEVNAGCMVAADKKKLNSLTNLTKSTQTDAETGTDNTKYMTPLATKQAIDKFSSKIDIINMDNFEKEMKKPDGKLKDQNDPSIKNKITDAQCYLDLYNAYVEIGATISTMLDKKVDIVQGKELSTNDFDNSYKEKVDNSFKSASVTKTSSDIKITHKRNNNDTSSVINLPSATSTVAGVMNAADKKKLDSLSATTLGLEFASTTDMNAIYTLIGA